MNNYNGLTEKEVIKNRKEYGKNEIIKENTNSFFKLFIESLGDPIIKILLIALAIKLVFLFRDFNWFETLGILIAIFISSLISTVSEYGSEKAFLKMQEESLKLKCKVKRDGKITELYFKDIVKDDIVILQQGDKVPADGILIYGTLEVDESSITGESNEVHKDTIKNNKLYMGTIIYDGFAYIRITNVGNNTFYGKIALELNEKNDESPLKIRLRNLATTISNIGYVGAFLAVFSYLFYSIIVNNNFVMKDIISTLTNFHLMAEYIIYSLTLAVTIIIVSVPEGLPMMITLVLSSNMKRMIKNNVLVRKLVGIETSGSINILFSDKTGTLTDGKLKVIKIIDGSLNNYHNKKELNNNYKEILKVSMIINNSSFYDKDKIIGGNITDRCLLEFFDKEDYSYIKKIKEIPFNSKNKYMITVIDDKNARNLIKGAPEIIVGNCKYYYDIKGNKKLFINKNKIKNIIEEESNKGNRLIALAISNNKVETNFDNMIFVGLVLIKDNIRPDASLALNIASEAGIKTIMLTGDNKNTAVTIAKEIGIIKSNDDIVLTSDELNKKSDSEVKKIIPNLKVLARSLPQDKSRLVRLAKEMNYVVGMTGDGVNDAPALKKADVGFCLGTGSQVAKDASDIVILDNNFMSITKAILYGRTIFKSIRKFIIFQLTVNLCALSISIIGPFIGVSTPVTTVQMLWINMVMDTLAGLAFSYEPALRDYMKEKPKEKNEKIINSYMYNEILITGIYTTMLLILFLKLPFIRNLFLSYNSFMTAFFGLFIFCGIFNCFNAHTVRINILSNILKNKMFIIIILFISIIQIIMIYYGGELFRTVPLTLKEFIIMFLFSLTVIPIDIIRKIIYKRKKISYGV